MASADLALKCTKKDGSPLTELEKQVAQTMVDLQQSLADMRSIMREMTFVMVKETETGGARDAKKCVLIYVPVPQLRLYRQVQVRLVRELEKKLGGKHVMIIAYRRILPKQKRGTQRVVQKQKRPRSRTMNSVHEAILTDLVFPSEIVGKRTRVKLDGKRIIKVHLDKNQLTNLDHKLDAIKGVYKKLTGKEIQLEFPEPIF